MDFRSTAGNLLYSLFAIVFIGDLAMGYAATSITKGSVSDGTLIDIFGRHLSIAPGWAIWIFNQNHYWAGSHWAAVDAVVYWVVMLFAVGLGWLAAKVKGDES